MSTADFIERYMTEKGIFLIWNTEGTCVFLDSQGCIVHEDRPLVCRLYPLGRHVLNTLDESFSEFKPDLECRGVYGNDGKIIDYLESQDALPFMVAADKYLSLFWELYNLLNKDVIKPVNYIAAERYDIIKDVDTSVAKYCKKTNIPFPENMEEKISVHIQAIQAWAYNSKKGKKNEKN